MNTHKPCRQSRLFSPALLIAMAFAAPIGAPALAQSPGGGTPNFNQPPGPKDKAPKKTTPTEEPSRGEKVDLRPRFEKGAEIRYKLRMNSDNKLTGAGLPGVPELPDLSKPANQDGKKKGDEATGQQMENEIDLVMRVKETDPEKGSTIDLVYERVKMKITSGGSTIESDSAVPPRKNSDDDLLAPIVKSMVGQTMTLTVDPSGNITKVTGGDGLALPASMQSAGLVPDASTLGPLFGPINTKKSGSGIAHVGDKWTNQDAFALAPFGGLKMTTDHTFRSHKNNEADIFFNGRIEPDTESGKPGGTGAAPIKLSGTTYRGKYLFDTRSGQLKSMESEMELRMDPAGQGGTSGSFKTFTKIERQPARSGTKRPTGG